MHYTVKRILLFVSVIIVAMQAYAQYEAKPLWVKHGVGQLNRKRSNNTYTFVAYNTTNVDANALRKSRLKPLLEDLGRRYGVPVGEIRTDSLKANASSDRPTYRFTFRESGGDAVVYALLVDDFMHFEDFVNNDFAFEFYQLYALSEKNVLPVYDDIEAVGTSNAQATLRSIVPGLGQIYKGQDVKGYVIMGGEVALVAGAIYFHSRAKNYCDDMKRYPEVADSYRSKSNSWRNMRNLAIGCAGVLYIYNLVDAAVAKGSRRISVTPAGKQHLYVAPFVHSEGGGVSLALRF